MGAMKDRYTMRELDMLKEIRELKAENVALRERVDEIRRHFHDCSACEECFKENDPAAWKKMMEEEA